MARAQELTEDNRRPLPDYDGRGEDPTTEDDVLLWFPRIALSPFWVVSELVIRRPLGFIVAGAERLHLPAILVDFFTFGEERKAGVVPTVMFEFELRPSFGLYIFGDDFIEKNNDLRIHAAYGGTDWLKLTVGDRFHFVRDRQMLLARVEGSRRSDYIFAGVGPDVEQRDVGRYGEDRLEGSLTLEQYFESASMLRASARVRRSVFDRDATCCQDPSVAQQIANNAVDEPFRFDELTTQATFVEAAFDTRSALQQEGRGSGLRIEGYAEHAMDMDRVDESMWVRAGGAIGGFWDLYGVERVISLSLAVDIAEPLLGPDVPFTELVQYGGDERLRGFREGHLRGRAGTAATFEYRWPIWAFLDGRIQAAVGNVFSSGFSDFELDKLRASLSMGLSLTGRRDHNFSMLVGLGTETFEHGLEITSFRALVGTTRGF